MMHRRKFIKFLGSMAVALPLSATARPRDRAVRVGVLMGLTS